MPYTQLWATALLLIVGFVGFSELYWRYNGFLPTIIDTKMYWSEHRHKIYNNHKKKKLVIVGSSRAQLGLDPIALGGAFPNFDIVHLAIDGALPFEVIKDLCHDDAFDGMILADVTVPSLCVTDEQLKQKELAYLFYYHNTFQTSAAIEKRLNTALSVHIQSHLVIASPALSFKELLYNKFNPKKLYYHMHPNRFRPAQYNTRLSAEALAEHRAKRIEGLTQNTITKVPISKFEEMTRGDLFALYQRLQKRGGNMIFVRMPTTDAHWQIDEQMAPKKYYWDNLESRTGIPTIHFLDYSTLKDFKCPDTSHLDATDAPKFTKELAHIMHQKLQPTFIREDLVQ